MTRGERDYTQRVLATVRPMGIIGGRMIRIVDFENLRDSVDDYNADTGIVTDGDKVFEGDAAGSVTMVAAATEELDWSFPTSTSDIICFEMLYRPAADYPEDVELRGSIYNGTIYHYPRVRVHYDGANLLLQIWDNTEAWKTIETVGIGAFTAHWHLLYMKFNMGTGHYEIIQADAIRRNVTDEAYESSSSTGPPYAELSIRFHALDSSPATVYFDNIIMSYEEL